MMLFYASYYDNNMRIQYFKWYSSTRLFQRTACIDLYKNFWQQRDEEHPPWHIPTPSSFGIKATKDT